jgi:EAL domain-containing protein (putative c-di-GMP-specific phosphodiesterase class I)
MREEAQLIGSLWDSTILSLERDFSRILERAPTGCDAQTVRRIVSVSFTSEVARAYYLRPAPTAAWCGPLGVRRIYTLPPLPADGEVMLYLESSIRSRGLRTISTRGAASLVAELDPNVLSRLALPLSGNARRWDRFLVAGSGALVPWMNVAGSADSNMSLWQQSSWSPSRRVRLVQSISADHLLSRLQRSAFALLLLVAALSMTLMGWLRSRLRDRANPQRRLEIALRKRRFEPYVQPIVDVRSGRCVGGEILMRWVHPARGILPPLEFIALAEESRLIVPMSNMVMVKARDRLAPVVESHRELYFSFNITPVQLRTPGFDETLERIFDAASLPRKHVLLEVTERDVVDARSETALRAFREAGYKLALDDFGTGQSSLASIDRLAVDRLKIDREFVRHVDASTTERPVLDTIIALAHTLRIPLIAEGVETDAQWDYLAARGVQYVQGYLVARPMAIDEFSRWINAYHAEMPDPTTSAVPTPVSMRSAPVTGDTMRPTTAPRNDHMPALTPERILEEMRGLDGIDVRDRRHHLRQYPQCFVAADVVTWMTKRWSISRTVAVRIGERLTALGYIEHVVSEHDFADAYLFFQFAGAAADSGAVLPDSLPELETVARRLRDPDGIASGARRRYLLWYDNSFSGHELCEWLRSCFVLTESAAAGVARALMLRGDVVHVFDDRPFEATGELYRLR